MPKLYQIYKGVKLYPQRTASLFRRSNATLPPRSSMHIKGVESLLKVLSVYALVITCSFFAIPLIYSHSFAIISRDKTAATQRHIKCRMSQCRTDLCPSLPKMSIFHTIVPEAYIAFIGVVLSAWAFSWSSYWKEHWIVFAMKMRQYCGTRAVWISANPSPCNDIALRVQTPTPPLNGILRQTLSSREDRGRTIRSVVFKNETTEDNGNCFTESESTMEERISAGQSAENSASEQEG